MNLSTAVLDTGIITLYLSSKPPLAISELIKNITEQKIYAITLPIVFSEAFKHICVKKGKDYAKSTLLSFQMEVPVKIVDMDMILAYDAGRLKCQYRETLSYIDCALIALTISHKNILHTTEKELSVIPGLQLKQYTF